MKYRLRTLFVAILAAGIVLTVPARMTYLASRAAYHERKGQEYSAKIMEFYATPGGARSHDLKKPLSDEDAATRGRYSVLMRHHSKLMLEYQRATYRPWIVVRENSN